MAARFLARIILLLAVCLSGAGAAQAHAVVVETDPPDGAVLAAAPESVTIRFNEPVSLIAAQLLDARGRHVIGAEAAAVNGAIVELALPPALSSGTYVASYRVVSLDGHPVGGSLVFSIGEASTFHADAAAHDRPWRIAWTAVRTVLNGGLLAAAGGVLFLLLVAGSGPLAVSTAKIARGFAAVAVVAALLSVGVQGGLLTGGPIRDILRASVWGTGLASAFGRSATIALAGLALIIAGTLSSSPAGRIVSAAGAATALFSYAFAGHVMTAGPRWLTAPALLAHTSAVAFWIGSLLPLRAALADADAAPVVRRFSAIAVAAVAVLLAAGIVIAVLQVRSAAALVTTAYGWMLLGKLALVAGLLALATFNKLRLTPAFARHDPGAAAALRRTIGAEVVLAAAILAITAALGTTPPPRALGAGHAHTPGHHAAGEHHAHGLSVELSSAGLRAALTFSSAHAGANDVEIAIIDEGGQAVEAQEIVFTAANPAAGVEAIGRPAVRLQAGLWEVKGLQLVPAGEWSLGVEVLVSDFERPIFEGTVELR